MRPAWLSDGILHPGFVCLVGLRGALSLSLEPEQFLVRKTEIVPDFVNNYLADQTPDIGFSLALAFNWNLENENPVRHNIAIPGSAAPVRNTLIHAEKLHRVSAKTSGQVR